jgi:hypothetical protein
MQAARFGQGLGDSDGIVKKLITVHDASICKYLHHLNDYLPPNKHAALLMVSEYDLEAFQDLVDEYKGEITYLKTAEEASIRNQFIRVYLESYHPSCS